MLNCAFVASVVGCVVWSKLSGVVVLSGGFAVVVVVWVFPFWTVEFDTWKTVGCFVGFCHVCSLFSLLFVVAVHGLFLFV